MLTTCNAPKLNAVPTQVFISIFFLCILDLYLIGSAYSSALLDK